MGRAIKYPFHKLNVGDSCEYKPESFSEEDYQRFRSAISAYRKRSGKDFLVISVPGGVWVGREQ